MMRTPRQSFARLAAAVAAIGIVAGLAAIGAQRPTTPGQVVARPDEGRQPEFPQPTIRDYKPRSTLVVPQHPVPRAKYPVIDIHSHQPSPISSAQFDTLVK